MCQQKWITRPPILQICPLPVGPHCPHCAQYAMPTGRSLCLNAHPPQCLNSFYSCFNPQINHHLFCKAFPISQAEFNASAFFFFFFESKLSLRIMCPVSLRLSFLSQNRCSLPLHLNAPS